MPSSFLLQRFNDKFRRNAFTEEDASKDLQPVFHFRNVITAQRAARQAEREAAEADAATAAAIAAATAATPLTPPSTATA